MEQAMEVQGININKVQALLADHGCETQPLGDNILKIRDLDSGITMRAVLEDNILFCTVTCMTVPEKAITPDVMKKMLDANNGISTSGFQLYYRGDGTISITLNNFCKLLAMGPDDEDDILSCLEFLAMDVYAARVLLKEIVK
jgi:hypothetical protein